ncbi:hypothetical protein [Sporocytophaga myxococcoides]|uniref:hypothetical protein n=1 Tax=Sporocytophaga myxococcoides TaxID=153721 RepID=UPI00041EE399|nr:hypothetical protein [Sporocytophaga myxococcoides]
MWPPIKIDQLRNEILKGELELNDEQLNFWDLIKIEPEKWTERNYGQDSGGFWVVAVFGRNVIFYNDIEEGFNVSEYDKHGEIKDYVCNQSGLNSTVIGIMERIKANRH